MGTSVTTGFQLSPQQKRLWLAEDPSGLLCQASILVKRKLEPSAVKSAVEELVARYEILRTTFRQQPGMKLPLQIINASLAVDWQQFDVAGLAEAEQQERIRRIESEASTKLNAKNGPVVSIGFVTLGTDRAWLLISVLALCADRLSLQNIVHELKVLLAGEEFADQPLQYADFSQWQHDLLQAEEDEEAGGAKAYWNEMRQAWIPPVLPFQKKNVSGGFEPETIYIPFTSAGPADDHGIFFLAAWHAFLHRIAGQTEMALGYVSDGRSNEDLAGLVGPVAKILPVRFAIDDDPIVRNLIEQTQAAVARALKFQDYLPADFESTPVTFAAEKLPASMRDDGDFAIVREHGTVAPFRANLKCQKRNGAWSIELQYDPRAFDRSSAEGLAASFAVFLKSAAENPDAHVSEFDLLTRKEQGELASRWNRTTAEFPRNECVHYLFEAQAARVPDQPALRFEEDEFTYSQLNAQANQLANLLRKSGVKPNTPVGLCVERSGEMILGLLGILKSGGAYLPLVPDTPKARLAHQLSESGALAIVTEERFLPNLPEFTDKIICLDRDAALLRAEAAGNPEQVNKPDDLVYVIYTSGSTGTPKGVAVRHSSLVNYSTFILKRLGLGEDQPGLHFATVSTISADLGNTSVFPALTSGGCLHVISYETAMAGNVFADYLAKHPVDVLKITPSHLTALLNSSSGKMVLPRRFLITGGEALSWNLVERMKSHGNCAVINHYGPTEATVGCCTYSVEGLDSGDWAPATVPIGQPIANAQTYILDKHFRPVPVGVAGELCIGGDGLAQGYLNQPHQTVERFVANPFSSGERIYCTGDLARYLPDGNIEFLGRIDQQVKIRGFRVEPAEIETAIKKYPAVGQAVVVPRLDKGGDLRLVAYIVPVKHPGPDAEDLRAFLQQYLPDYMIPSAFVSLDAIPLTANGKIDVRALPSPDQAQRSERAVTAARNPVEEGLIGIWKEVLGSDRVGVFDDFFELGGHSLLATQVIARIRSDFNVQLPLRTLFEAPTIARLAEAIANFKPAEDGEVARLLQELEGLSDEEAERLLSAEISAEREAGPR
jgi:amino acid adenylation domain-containing protein